jgi:hypothetical protein
MSPPPPPRNILPVYWIARKAERYGSLFFCLFFFLNFFLYGHEGPYTGGGGGNIFLVNGEPPQNIGPENSNLSINTSETRGRLTNR